MAVDKLVDSTQLNSDLTAVANAIRTKSGTSAQLSFPNGMTQAIADLPADGTNYVDVTLTQDYTSGTSFVNALGTASGFANFLPFLQVMLPKAGLALVRRSLPRFKAALCDTFIAETHRAIGVGMLPEAKAHMPTMFSECGRSANA